MPSSDPSGRVREIDEQVGSLGLEALLAAQFHGFPAQVDAPRRDAGIAHQFQKFTAPAADIQHFGTAGEIWQIELLPLPDVVLRAAEALGKAGVIEIQLRRGGQVGPGGEAGVAATGTLVAARCRISRSSE